MILYGMGTFINTMVMMGMMEFNQNSAIADDYDCPTIVYVPEKLTVRYQLKEDNVQFTNKDVK